MWRFVTSGAGASDDNETRDDISDWVNMSPVSLDNMTRDSNLTARAIEFPSRLWQNEKCSKLCARFYFFNLTRWHWHLYSVSQSLGIIQRQGWILFWDIRVGEVRNKNTRRISHGVLPGITWSTETRGAANKRLFYLRCRITMGPIKKCIRGFALYTELSFSFQTSSFLISLYKLWSTSVIMSQDPNL